MASQVSPKRMPIRSAPFRLSNKQFASIATRHFVRRYWPVYALAILVGIGIMVLGGGGASIIIGLMFVLYPFMAPLRYSMLVAARARPFTSVDLTYEVTDEELIVRSEGGGVTRGSLESIKRVDIVSDTYVVQFGRGTFVLLPIAPMPEAHRDAVRRALLERNSS
jgi:hypothetical protein